MVTLSGERESFVLLNVITGQALELSDSDIAGAELMLLGTC